MISPKWSNWRGRKIEVNVYLEDWSNGMRHSNRNVFNTDFYQTAGETNHAPDTLGVLIPSEVFDFIEETVLRYPGIHFDFHGHNDYDLGTANVLEAFKGRRTWAAPLKCGMGERAGNAPLAVPLRWDVFYPDWEIFP